VQSQSYTVAVSESLNRGQKSAKIDVTNMITEKNAGKYGLS